LTSLCSDAKAACRSCTEQSHACCCQSQRNCSNDNHPAQTKERTTSPTRVPTSPTPCPQIQNVEEIHSVEDDSLDLLIVSLRTPCHYVPQTIWKLGTQTCDYVAFDAFRR
jgi:hypothetical protein